jgi:uncharacterized protein
MKRTKTEDEYIWVQELQTRMARLEQEQQAQTRAETLRLKELHWMRCPKCGQELATETCDSVEIDLCPSCKGVWLDAGELGTIVGIHAHRVSKVAPSRRREGRVRRAGFLTGVVWPQRGARRMECLAGVRAAKNFTWPCRLLVIRARKPAPPHAMWGWRGKVPARTVPWARQPGSPVLQHTSPRR